MFPTIFLLCSILNFLSGFQFDFFIRKLFQSTRLYIKGIVRVSASECAWKLELLYVVINKLDLKMEFCHSNSYGYVLIKFRLQAFNVIFTRGNVIL